MSASERTPSGVANVATAVDYWSLPDDRRAELVDGKLYDMTPPRRVHQKLVIELAYLFKSHIDAHGGPCEVYPAPFAVNLTSDDATWVEPDLSVICDPDKLSDRGCEGAPDMIVEVVSPSNRSYDYFTKAGLYEQAGVREYWIVDPDKAHTCVYRYGPDGPDLALLPFDKPVTCGVLEGLSVTVADLLR